MMLPSTAYAHKTLYAHIEDILKEIKQGFASRVSEKRDALLEMRRSKLVPLDDGLIRLTKGKFLNAFPFPGGTIWNLIEISSRVTTPTSTLLEMITSRGLEEEYGHYALPTQTQAKTMLTEVIEASLLASIKKPKASDIFAMASQSSDLTQYFELIKGGPVKKPVKQTPMGDFHTAVDAGGDGSVRLLQEIDAVKTAYDAHELKAPQAIHLLNRVKKSLQVDEKHLQAISEHEEFSLFFREGNVSIAPKEDAPLEIIGTLRPNSSKMKRSGMFEVSNSLTTKIFDPSDNFANIVSAVHIGQFINKMPSLDDIVRHDNPIRLGGIRQ